MVTTTTEQRKAVQNRAELSSRFEGTTSQASYGKGFSRSYTEYLMQHIQTRTQRKARKNDSVNFSICCLRSLASN